MVCFFRMVTMHVISPCSLKFNFNLDSTFVDYTRAITIAPTVMDSLASPSHVSSLVNALA